MDITHGTIFVGMWILLLLLISLVFTVIDRNKEKRRKFEEENKDSPLSNFWRNLK